MNKKSLILSLFIIASGVNVFAQKNKKNSFNKKTNIELKTTTDSLSYAYGVGAAEHGLVDYLVQLEVLSDTATFNLDYRQKLNATTSSADKVNLQKKHQVSLDSINALNKENIQLFIQGMNARLEDTDKSKAYYVGLDLGSQMQRMAEEFVATTFKNSQPINLQLMAKGIGNVIRNEPLLFDNSTELVEAKTREIQNAQNLERKKESAGIIALSESFMAENAKREGIISLPSGLQYKIDKKGNGAIPTLRDKVKVHYTGRLTNGTVFDSSVDRGEPLTFGLQQVIPGWTEILQLMPVGSKWTIYVPYSLGYGDKDMGAIKPYSNLIFEIELLGIEK